MLSKPALQAILPVAHPQRAGGVILLAMDLHLGHHLDKAHANRAPAGDLPGVEPPLRVAAPADNGEIRPDNLVEQHALAALQRHLRLNKHFAHRRGLAGAVGQQRPLAVLRHRLKAHLEEVAFHRRQVIQQPGETVAHGPLPALRRRQHVAGGDRQINHRFRVVAALLLVAVEQRLSRFTVDHQRQLPRQVEGVAHAAVVSLPLPDRHDVRRIAGQQHPVNAKALGKAGVMRIDPLADQLDAIRVRQHFAQQAAHIVRFAELSFGFAGHHHKFKAAHAVGQRGGNVGSHRVAAQVNVRSGQRVVSDIDDDPLIRRGFTFEGDVQRTTNKAGAAVAGHQPVRAHRLPFAVRSFKI